MATQRVLVVGSGGREHALAWRLARDPDAPEILVAPGNAGIGRQFRQHAVPEQDAPALVALCRSEGIGLVVIGPETPLALGVADALRDAGVAVFGPSRAASRLESSKWFAKQLMIGAGVPTARAAQFQDLASARAALEHFGPPYVIKADGLAAGKGVCVTRERDAAEIFLTQCLEAGRFGESGRRVVVEEFLEGEEASVIAICDGREFLLLPAARDYKRAYDGDRGTNTGGMGAFAPAASIDAGLEQEVAQRIVRPMLAAFERLGTPYRGALYCGLMVSPAAELHVLEFNCRFGDPETQVVMPLLEGSLHTLLASAARGRLDSSSISRGRGSAVGVALVDEGYPSRVSAGGAIEGLEELMGAAEVLVFHAGSGFENGVWRVRGGRVAHVVARETTREAARARVYAAVGRLSGAGWRCRRDIAAPPEGAAGRRELLARLPGEA